MRLFKKLVGMLILGYALSSNAATVEDCPDISIIRSAKPTHAYHDEEKFLTMDIIKTQQSQYDFALVTGVSFSAAEAITRAPALLTKVTQLVQFSDPDCLYYFEQSDDEVSLVIGYLLSNGMSHNSHMIMQHVKERYL